MRPIIGIVSRVEYPGETGKLIINEHYRRAIVKYGGNLMAIVPPQEIDYTKVKCSEQGKLTAEDKEMLIDQINKCDGILMPGGFKVNNFDRFICEYAIENDIPLLGICLGMQIMANYKNEEFHVEKNDSFIEHRVEDGLVHDVTLDLNSKLYNIIKNERFPVTSRHFYHVNPNSIFDISSVSDDNYIESIEMKNKKFIIGVQWHPECMDDETSRKLFKYFIDVCKNNKKY